MTKVTTVKKPSKKQPTISFFTPGKNYFIRTVTHHHCGTFVGDTKQGEIVLKNASWIADDGRFTQALDGGVFSEVEVFPKDSSVLINRTAIIDAVEWIHPVPEKQK